MDSRKGICLPPNARRLHGGETRHGGPGVWFKHGQSQVWAWVLGTGFGASAAMRLAKPPRGGGAGTLLGVTLSCEPPHHSTQLGDWLGTVAYSWQKTLVAQPRVRGGWQGRGKYKGGLDEGGKGFHTVDGSSLETG